MNPYQILGIDPNATDDEVKKAYRTLSKKYHPDANINNPNQAAYTEKFKEVQNAYKTIMNDRKRGFTNRNYGNSQNTIIVVNIVINTMVMIKRLLMKLLVLLMPIDIKRLLIF